MRKIALLLLAFSFFSVHGFAQALLNGDFEFNSAGSDLINMNNATFNTTMSNTFGFGTWGGGTGNLDIITSTTYGLGPQNGSWYIAFTGGGTDQVTMQLNTPLIMGNSYSVTYYDNRWNTFTGPPMELGISTTNNSVGTIVYTDPGPVSGTQWTLRTASFVAPITGQYLYVRSQLPVSGSVWTKVDNFSFGTVLPLDNLSMRAERFAPKKVNLEWAVAGDKGNIYKVERSRDGEAFFELGIGIPGTLGAEGWEFNFEDGNAPTEQLFYRLHFIDPNGKSTYSNVVKVQAINQTSNLLVYPNPAVETLTLSSQNSFLVGMWELKIFDLQGKLVLQQEGVDGFSQIELNVSGLKPGTYVLQMIQGGDAQIRKFTVL